MSYPHPRPGPRPGPRPRPIPQHGFPGYNQGFGYYAPTMWTPDDMYLREQRKDNLMAAGLRRERNALQSTKTTNAILLGTVAVIGIGALIGVVAYGASK